MRAVATSLALCLATLCGCGGPAESPDAGIDLAIPVATMDLARIDDLASSDAAAATCPAAMPSGACSSGGLSCDYQSNTCLCVAPELTWTCCGSSLGPACPFTQPANGSPCCIQQSTSPMCGYACGSALATTCTCDAMHWSCVAGGC